MKNRFIVLFFLLAGLSMKAQDASNNLTGYFKNTKADDLYSSIYLDGKGHAIISDAFAAEYVQKGDQLYVFPDKSVFIFKIEKGKLKGTSNWVKKSNFKLTEVPELDEAAAFSNHPVDARLLYDFYRLNYTEGTDETSFYAFENEADYFEQMEVLCDKGLTAACGAYFGMLYLEASGGLNKLLEGNEEQKVEENPKMEEIAKRMISLGDVRGYGLLGSYYYALGKEEKAIQIYTEGMDKGDQNSVAVIFQLEMEKTINEETETEE